MENNSLGQAMYEMNIILENTDAELIKRIPDNLIKLIKNGAKAEKEFKYDKNKKLKDQSISNITRGIISIIYRDYLCNEGQRKIYKEYYSTVKQEIEMEKSERYSVDKIFEKNNTNKGKESTALVPYKKDNIWTKIKRKLLFLFK